MNVEESGLLRELALSKVDVSKVKEYEEITSDKEIISILENMRKTEGFRDFLVIHGDTNYYFSPDSNEGYGRAIIQRSAVIERDIVSGGIQVYGAGAGTSIKSTQQPVVENRLLNKKIKSIEIKGDNHKLHLELKRKARIYLVKMKE